MSDSIDLQDLINRNRSLVKLILKPNQEKKFFIWVDRSLPYRWSISDRANMMVNFVEMDFVVQPKESGEIDSEKNKNGILIVKIKAGTDVGALDAIHLELKNTDDPREKPLAEFLIAIQILN